MKDFDNTEVLGKRLGKSETVGLTIVLRRSFHQSNPSSLPIRVRQDPRILYNQRQV